MKSYQNAAKAAKIIVDAFNAFPGLKYRPQDVNGADLVDFLTERIAPLSIDHTAAEVVELLTERIAPLSIDHTAAEVVELLTDTVDEEFVKGQ